MTQTSVITKAVAQGRRRGAKDGVGVQERLIEGLRPSVGPAVGHAWKLSVEHCVTMRFSNGQATHMG